VGPTDEVGAVSDITATVKREMTSVLLTPPPPGLYAPSRLPESSRLDEPPVASVPNSGSEGQSSQHLTKADHSVSIEVAPATAWINVISSI
jgi:hypothetical protein